VLATPLYVPCDRCQKARNEIVMARVPGGAAAPEWTCPVCHAVWVLVTDEADTGAGSRTGWIDAAPTPCPCPLRGPLQLAREAIHGDGAKRMLWVCASCGAGQPVQWDA
jgi:hypothetical protein